MDLALTDRRSEHRFPLPPAADVTATMRPGCRVVLVDVSGHGALIEAPRPLRPGGRIQLLVSAGDARHAITARVLRCVVAALEPTAGVTYRGGIAFDAPVQWPWAPSAHARAGRLGHERPIRAPHGHTLPASAGIGAVAPVEVPK